MRAWLVYGVVALSLGGCGGTDGSTSHPLRDSYHRLLTSLGYQPPVAASELAGRWTVHRSVSADSGLKVPSNFSIYVEFGLERPDSLKPTKDSVMVFPRRITGTGLVAFENGGVFRDPSTLVVGDGLYAMEGDSVRVTGPRGTRVFGIRRYKKIVWRGGSMPADWTLGWSDAQDKTRLVMTRVE
jgi:hypothetical protein